MDFLQSIEKELAKGLKLPDFSPGDNITVNYKIVEGDKERVQPFRGDVLQRRGHGTTATFTVRKISNGVGVERVFQLYSPNIEGIEINKTGRVRRAKLYYLRNLKGKKARITEKRASKEEA